MHTRTKLSLVVVAVAAVATFCLISRAEVPPTRAEAIRQRLAWLPALEGERDRLRGQQITWFDVARVAAVAEYAQIEREVRRALNW